MCDLIELLVAAVGRRSQETLMQAQSREGQRRKEPRIEAYWASS